MTFKLTRRATLIGLSVCAALPAHAQTLPQDKAGPDVTEAVSLEQRAIFDVAPITGTLKETVQKGQQLVWVGKGRTIVDFKSRMFRSRSCAMRAAAT